MKGNSLVVMRWGVLCLVGLMVLIGWLALHGFSHFDVRLSYKDFNAEMVASQHKEQPLVEPTVRALPAQTD